MSPVEEEEEGGCEDRLSQRSLCNSLSPPALVERQRLRAEGTIFSTSELLLIYTLRQGWAAMCHRGLRVCRFHSKGRLRWRTALIGSFSVADSVLISDIFCYTGLDCNANLETRHLPIGCEGPILQQSHIDILDTCLDSQSFHYEVA